jgi:hypothetical protein
MKNARHPEGMTSAREQREYNPRFPHHGTHPARLLALLLTRRSIDPLTAWSTAGIYRLADTVYRLRGMGWNVVTNRLDVTNRFGEQCHVAQYVLRSSFTTENSADASHFIFRELEALRRRAA